MGWEGRERTGRAGVPFVAAGGICYIQTVEPRDPPPPPKPVPHATHHRGHSQPIKVRQECSSEDEKIAEEIGKQREGWGIKHDGFDWAGKPGE